MALLAGMLMYVGYGAGVIGLFWFMWDHHALASFYLIALALGALIVGGALS